MKSLGLLVVCLILLAIAGVAYHIANNSLVTTPAPGGEGVFCTMEAKLCPDGSYVGRGGPNCEFAACPTTPTTWRTYEDKQEGFSIQYPPELTVHHPAAGAMSLVFFSGGEEYKEYDIDIIKISDTSEGFPQQLIDATFFDGSGMNPKSFDEFASLTLNNKDNWYYIRTGIFEAVLSLRYYFPTPKGIYAFNLVARGVDWQNPQYNSDTDAAHLILKQMLPTFKSTN